MESALSRNMSINQVAKFHGVPWTTFQDCLSGKVHGKSPGPAPYLTINGEKELFPSIAEVGDHKTKKRSISEAIA